MTPAHRPPAPVDLRERVRVELARALSESGGVRFAFGFGSFFEGLPYRDVDVAVMFGPGRDERGGASPGALQLQQSRLAGICERRIGLPVDVVDLGSAPLSLRFSAIRGTLLHAEDADEAASFIERTWLCYLDFEPFIRQQAADLFEG